MTSDFSALRVRERLLHLANRALDSEAIVGPETANVQLSELGLSSLRMVNLMLALEIEFDLVIPQFDITPENFHSIASIEAMLTRLLR